MPTPSSPRDHIEMPLKYDRSPDRKGFQLQCSLFTAHHAASFVSDTDKGFSRPHSGPTIRAFTRTPVPGFSAPSKTTTFPGLLLPLDHPDDPSRGELDRSRAKTSAGQVGPTGLKEDAQSGAVRPICLPNRPAGRAKPAGLKIYRPRQLRRPPAQDTARFAPPMPLPPQRRIRTSPAAPLLQLSRIPLITLSLSSGPELRPRALARSFPSQQYRLTLASSLSTLQVPTPPTGSGATPPTGSGPQPHSSKPARARPRSLRKLTLHPSNRHSPSPLRFEQPYLSTSYVTRTATTSATH
ncbi:hypothetical protein DPEC_G00146350 [Dallia pectoralis]|uniref:Uncharacterized protein n=1 Tax=Dallia pectoralis TaxID=75939 RepID=A0ACC2GP26_DALPE|nr:hypothetical protein DPEC_G00146350 [Dallia pectoralis]